MMNKKGQLKLNKTIEIALLIILTVVILFSLYAALIPEVQTAGDSLNDSNRCNTIGCFYNTSARGVEVSGCRINASIEGNLTACPSNLQTIPLASLFKGGGIVVLLLIVTLILVIIKTVMPKGKK